ncbi:MAG: Uma2 family endonuclease [Isosphaeraceae bacterium]
MSTITSTQATTSPPMLPGASAPPASPELFRFSVAQYEQMGDAGILTEDDRVELVEGLIYRKPMKKGPHSIACRETAAALSRVVPAATHFVTREDPVSIPGWASMPEPDISVVRGRSREYSEQPKAGDISLVAEVANKARLAYDQGEKLRAYASGGIPVYWIINLVDRQVEVYTGPGQGHYPPPTIYKAGQMVPVVIDGQPLPPIAVDDILP